MHGTTMMGSASLVGLTAHAHTNNPKRGRLEEWWWLGTASSRGPRALGRGDNLLSEKDTTKKQIDTLYPTKLLP
jgi:hypothetical protein